MPYHANAVDLLQHLLPNATDLTLENWNLDTGTHQVILHLASTQVIAHCPLCHCPSDRIHSRYQRTLKDLPLVQFTLTLLVAVGKFFCLNQDCPRKIFTERLPAVVAPWARRTLRYTEHLKAMGLALGGAAAARLSHQLGYGHSRNAILDLIAALPLPMVPPLRMLGVDDFALRKGHRYGTILVDLEQHQPIALLADRTAQTLAAWLKEHPGVEILSRDRSKPYRRGMSEGAPDAIQVADRFHLLQNLEETLEKVFVGYAPVLKRVEKAQLQAAGVGLPEVLEGVSALPSQTVQKRAQRLEKYEQTHALRKQGYLIGDIAHHLGIGKRTVYTYLSHPTFPEWQPLTRRGRSELEAYKAYLLSQWMLGHQQTKQLFVQIQQQGYPGSYPTVARYTQQLRQSLPQLKPTPESLNDLPGRGPAPKIKSAPQQSLSARRAAWLILRRPDTLTPNESELLEHLEQQPELSAAITLAQSFIELVRQRVPDKLNCWLEQAKNSSIQAFQRFAKGLEEDYDAVKAGLTWEVSNGPVEGQNNRLKMLKRQMFGRAGLDLLARRLILTT